MNETLQEYVDSRGVEMRVDRENGVIRGVKILGLDSRNGRSYLPDALAKAAQLYEGAKVNVNHPKGNPLGPRDYQERIGVIRNAVSRPAEGLFADFHFNPKHALAEQLAWDAGHAPENVGFSHNVMARTSRQGEAVVVDEITRVLSVDLVADPATTRGLFEQAATAEAARSPAADKGRAQLLAGLSADELKRQRPDLVDALVQEQATRLSRLQTEFDRLSAAEASQQKRGLVRRLLAEFGLPDADATEDAARAVVSARFLESLLAAPNEQVMRALVEDRAGLARLAGSRARPLSRDQHQVYGAAPLDARSFVKAITR